MEPAKEPETKELKTCPDCGQEGIKNMGVHKRYCKAKKDTLEPEQPEPSEAQPHPLIISDVQATKFDDLVAWFMGADGKRFTKPLNYIGLVHDDRGVIPTVLVIVSDGALVPPYLVVGFIGLFSEYQEFPEIEEPQPQPEQPKIEVNEPSKAPQSNENHDRIITPPEIHASQPEKKSIFAWPFGKKKEKEKSQSEMTNAELATEIIKTSNGGTA